ncbi:hypothetical protein A3F29_03440 [Candidatus Roizmanbacteria bacterium RIFCSPHIGHO2_12_FULL_33_9]|uniref:Uncharacterized protein n=1 Tax=Candidatus Roizmanbacteria bacterium RIFCSPHIGHO2_12_FULL_33_9 TaxID=1802045 RepID=A0A1F7HFN3_9BACT|nr:MAG: hypothetical protein A3F29_03440 [Candidatus Roizmanbacteria bacterium RIFCSPHIGHO2_12_FULL_33_9]
MADEIGPKEQHIGQLVFPNPYTTLTDLEYLDTVRQENKVYRADIIDKLNGLDLPQGACLALSGSDGKSEKHIQSLPELILIIDSEEDRFLALKVVEWYDQKYGSGSYVKEFDTAAKGMPEVKVVFSDLPISNTNELEFGGSGFSLYPDRILNSSFIKGDEESHLRAKIKTLQEMATTKIVRGLKDQIRDYKRPLHTGFYRGEAVFSVDDNEKTVSEYYDEHEGAYTVGFKIPFLRSVQRKLDILTAQLLRSGKISSIDEFAKLYPSNTLERMSFLSEYVDITGLNDLKNAYLWFLRAYHQAQEEYKTTQKRIVAKFDMQEFIRHREAVLRFIS